MQLITSRNNNCVAASVAMLFDLTLKEIKSHHLFSDTYITYPFVGPWEKVPKVPSMAEVCEWAYTTFQVGLVQFPYALGVKPHHDCNTVSAYPDAPEALARQMSYGPGLLEGISTTANRGHMCAWDGEKILDPRGRSYPPNERKYNQFQIHQFWLKVN